VLTRYRPAWWLSNPHLATMWGKFFRRPIPLPTRTERWDTPDGDFVEVVRLDGEPGRPVVLLLHGLEGGPDAHYARGFMRAMHQRGWSANLLVFRTCGGEMNRLPRSYHSGETGDLAFVADRLMAERPGAPTFLAGVSLGGNVLLKWLGERGAALTDRVTAAVAVSTPYDLARSCAHIDRGFSAVYSRNFLRTLRTKALHKIERHPGIADSASVRAARTLWAFDDAFTSVVHGFVDAADYYARSSSIHYLAGIRVPTLLLSAMDDPFHPRALLEDVTRIAGTNPFLRTEFVGRGGHVGFVEGAFPWSPSYYLDRRIPAFFDDVLEESARPPMERSAR
jgi:uncharacterized protein